MKIKKGDTVKIISGKEKGKTSKVIRVYPKEMKVVVEGVNLVKKHTKRTNNAKDPGGIVESEKPINISKVMLIEDGKAVRVGFKVEKDGKKVRISKKTNKAIN